MRTFDLTKPKTRTAVQRVASLHNWFVKDHDNGVVCRHIVIMPSGNIDIQYKFFDNESELRAWAGCS